jgi:hypothetical protein
VALENSREYGNIRGAISAQFRRFFSASERDVPKNKTEQEKSRSSDQDLESLAAVTKHPPTHIYLSQNTRNLSNHGYPFSPRRAHLQDGEHVRAYGLGQGEHHHDGSHQRCVGAYALLSLLLSPSPSFLSLSLSLSPLLPISPIPPLLPLRPSLPHHSTLYLHSIISPYHSKWDVH